jgi:hypothetical protein
VTEPARERGILQRAARSLAFLAACLWSSPAGAQLGPNGAPITTSQYTVDLFQGTVLSGSRAMGLAGSYLPIAEGSEGNLSNAAAPAVRTPWLRQHIDYDLGGGVAFPTTLRKVDWFNSGSDRTNLTTSRPDAFVSLDLEGTLMVGSWGFGAAVVMQQYALRRDQFAAANGELEKLRAQFLVGSVLVARSIAQGQLAVGAGVRISALSVVQQNPSQDGNTTLFSTTGAGVEGGVLWRPNGVPVRWGATFRSAVRSKVDAKSSVAADPTTGDRILGRGTSDELYLPDHVALPWEGAVGVAVQLGPRPLNPPWLDPEERLGPIRAEIRQRAARREAESPEASDEADRDRAELARAKAVLQEQLRQRERQMARRYLLVSATLRVVGPVSRAVGVESFLQRMVDRSGRRTVLEPYLGLESEVVPHWLKLRTGTYYEPTRFENVHAGPRVHACVGAETKLFPWTVFGLFDPDTHWRLQGAADAAARYFNWSISVGVWH